MSTYFPYITHYIIPVLIIMAIILIIAGKYVSGVKFREYVLICIGFLLGWASAFISLYLFYGRK